MEAKFLDFFAENIVVHVDTDNFNGLQDFKVNYWETNKRLFNSEFANYSQRTYINNVVVTTYDDTMVANFRILRHGTDQKSVKQRVVDATYVWAYQPNGWKIVFLNFQDVLISFSPLTAPSS